MKKNVIFAKVKISKSWAKLFINEKNENKKQSRQSMEI